MRNSKNHQIITGVLCAISSETLFGLSYIFTKRATGHVSELALLGWRFLVAAIVMLVLAALGVVRVNLKGRPLRPLLFVALWFPCLYFIGETVGISHTTALESGVFLACIPAAALASSTILLRQRPSVHQVVGVLVTLVGVLLTVVAVSVSSSLSIVGYAFLLLAVVSNCMCSIYVSKADGYSEMEFSYVMLLAGSALFVELAVGEAILQGNLQELATLPFREPRFAIAILYQGIVASVLASWLSNRATKRLGVNRAASFIGISTVVSILAGILVLREPFSPWQIAGAVVIVAGVCIANAGV